MIRILLLLLMSITTVLFAQTISPKKCKVCGNPLAQCPYKGRHPQLCEYCDEPLTTYHKGVHSITKGTHNGHEWVDLGLSVKWATCNIGARNQYEYGSYYAWGETRTKLSYTWDNCFDCDGGSGNEYTWSAKIKITPSSGHDAARENWGGSWRMPTDTEIEELCRQCKWDWKVLSGHYGYVVTGPNGNSIFLPAAGSRSDDGSCCQGEMGHYWSSSLSTSFVFCARSLYFTDNLYRTDDYMWRSYGYCVRPVTK